MMLVCKASFPFTLPHVVHYTFFCCFIPRVFQTSDDELHGLYSIVVVVVMPQISNLGFFQNEPLLRISIFINIPILNGF